MNSRSRILIRSFKTSRGFPVTGILSLSKLTLPMSTVISRPASLMIDWTKPPGVSTAKAESLTKALIPEKPGEDAQTVAGLLLRFGAIGIEDAQGPTAPGREGRGPQRMPSEPTPKLAVAG